MGWLAGLLLLVGCATRHPVSVPEPSPPALDTVGRYVVVVDHVSRDPQAQVPPALHLWLALPVERPEQRVEILETLPLPTRVDLDPGSGTRVAYWSVPDPPEGGRLTFSVKFHVQGWPVSPPIDPALVFRPASDSEEVRRYTGSEPWLEASPEISAKAREIVGRETNPYLQARLVFDWIVREMTYDYPAVQDRGVTRAFSTLKGDCGEFSHVFIVMMRSLGVPARSVVANWLDAGGHAWAEAYLPPYGWVPFDTSGAQLVSNGLKGQMPEEKVAAFVRNTGLTSRDPSFLAGGLYPRRLIVSVGENHPVRGPEYGERTFRFLQPGGAGAWPPAIEMPGLSKSTVQAGFYLWDKAVDDPVALERRARIALGPAYLGAGLLDRAIPALRDKLEEMPDDATTWFQLGQALFKSDDLPGAKDAFQRSLAGQGGSTKRTTDTWAHIFLGMVADLEGRRDDARARYQAAIDAGADYSGSLALARKLLEEGYER